MDNWHCPERTEDRPYTLVEKVCITAAIAVIVAMCIFGPMWSVR